MALILFLYALLALSFTLGKAALVYIEPILFVGIRMTFSGIVLLSYQYFFRKKYWKFEWQHVWLFVQIILFHIYFAYVLEYWALQYISSAKVCLLYNLSPFITALFAYIVLSDRLTTKKFFGLLIGFSGFLPVLMETAPVENTVKAFSFFSWPEIAMLGSVIASSYGWILMKRFVRKEGYSVVMVNGVGMLGGGILAMLTSLYLEGMPQINVCAASQDSLGQYISQFICLEHAGIAAFIVYVVVLTIISNVIFYNLYGYLLKQYSATFLSFAGFMAPLFAALFGWFLLGETVSPWFFASIAIISFGLYLFYQEELKTAE